MRDIGKRPITVIPPQLVAAQIGDVDIDVAVVVEVGGGDTHSISASVDAAFLSNVGEFEGAGSVGVPDGVVAIELGAKRGAGREDSLAQLLIEPKHAALD